MPIIKVTQTGFSEETSLITSASQFSVSNPPMAGIMYTNNTGSDITLTSGQIIKTTEFYTWNGTIFVKISKTPTDILHIQNFAGDFSGVDSPLIPVVSPSGNGITITKIQYRRTVGTVVGGDTIQLKINGVAQSGVVLTLSTTNELTSYILPTPIVCLETDEISTTRPTNATLAGLTSIFNFNN
jgi:hypothetical protein